MEEPQVFANSPDFTLDFEIVYIKKEFTVYQMYWHYAWIAITLVFMFVPKIGFFYEMTQLHQNFWSRQQVTTILTKPTISSPPSRSSVVIDGQDLRRYQLALTESKHLVGVSQKQLGIVCPCFPLQRC